MTHPSTPPGHNVLRGSQDFSGQGPLDGKIGNDDCVFWVLAPSLEQLPGQAGLQHAGGGHHHTRPCPLQLPGPAELLDKLELEGVGPLHMQRSHVTAREGNASSRS